ncbi:hypothetical protein BKG77_06885 [Mycobacteroides chelonae]|uniref:holin n=1 Tax=Mycobacteroides chelonae TaxID=1774 RepID=UPI0008A92278|nr:holin [Mycobacteroides chelonae]OHU23386.1 hypothetical protein BKG77_06885 [Mycobacteroides chelonae]
MLTKQFWLDAIERAVRATAASVGGVFVADATVATVSWQGVAVVAGTAALTSLLLSLQGARIGDPDSASLVKRP